MKGFNARVFVGLSLAFLTLFLAVSGIILYISPYGRNAFRVDWNFLRLNKEQWISCHIITGFAFLVFVLWHMVLNIRQLFFYLAGRAQAALAHKIELAAAEEGTPAAGIELCGRWSGVSRGWQYLFVQERLAIFL